MWVEARPVGVLYMRDEAGEDAKLICVPPKEPRWADVHDLEDLTPALRAEIQHFFEVYKALEPNKYSSSHGMDGRDAAWREIDEGRATYARTHDRRLNPALPRSTANAVRARGDRRPSRPP